MMTLQRHKHIPVKCDTGYIALRTAGAAIAFFLRMHMHKYGEINGTEMSGWIIFWWKNMDKQKAVLQGNKHNGRWLPIIICVINILS